MSSIAGSPRLKLSNSATATALPSEVDPLSITMRAQRDALGLRAALRSDASASRSLSREETDDTTPFELVDPVNASATLRDLPATGSRRRRAHLALVATFVLAIAGYISTAI